MEKKSPTIKICDWIMRYSIHALVFLLPVLFLPWTSNVLDFNKQTLLVLLVFIALFFWMIKVLISGKFSLNLYKTHAAMLGLFLVYLLSTIFSIDKYGSFWGWPLSVSESLLTIICFAILYFLVSSVFPRKEIFNLITLLAISSFLVVVVGIFQLLGLFIFPFLNFARSASFNTIGLVGGLGMFLAVLTPLLAALEIAAKKWWLKIIFGIALLLNIVCFILINYLIVWWAVLVGSFLLTLFGILKKKVFDLRWWSIPTFFLVLSLFFAIFHPQFSVPQRATEVYLSPAAGFNVALPAIKEKPILGSGPGTFIYDFSKYKGNSFNNGTLWNVRFDGAGSKFLTIFATTGILGTLAFLALFIAVIFYGFKFLATEKNNDSHLLLLSGGVLISALVLFFAYFLYNSNISLDFLFFFLIAAFIGLAFQERKDYLLLPSSVLTLIVNFVFTIFLIFGLGLLFLVGERYIAEISYSNGESALARSDLDQGISNLGKAVRLNPNVDVYITELSQSYLSKALALAGNKNLSDTDKKNVQLLINNSINAAKVATDVSPNNVSNWSIRGFIYQSLIGLVPGAEDWSINSYDKASLLEPANPYYPTQEGITLIKKSMALPAGQDSSKNQILDQAKDKFDSAVKLKPDYSPALFQIAMVYQAEGKSDQEISALENTIKSAPNDVGLAFQIGVIYYQAGNYQGAKLALERAVALSPNYANALYFLGLTYDKLGQKDKAIAAISNVVNLNPNNADVKKVLSNLQSGKNALDGIAPKTPPQAPVQEAPPEKSKK